MGIGPVSYVVLFMLKVARSQHSGILTDPALQERPDLFPGGPFGCAKYRDLRDDFGGSRMSRILVVIQVFT